MRANQVKQASVLVMANGLLLCQKSTHRPILSVSLAKLLVLFLGCVLLVGPLEARTLVELRQAEKIALTLTGEPLSGDLRSKFVKGEIELEEIVDSVGQSPAFIEYYAQFWTRTIGVQSPLDAYQLESREGRSVEDQDNYAGVDRLTDDCPVRNVENLQKWIDNRINKLPRIQVRTDCEDAPRIEVYSDFTDYPQTQRAVEAGVGPDGNPILPGTAPLWLKAWTEIVKPARAHCDDDSVIMKVWWDPATVRAHAKYKNAKGYRVPPWVLKQCGPMLAKCGINEAPKVDTYMDEVNRDMSMEAGYLIAHTVAENKPFTDILTTPNTIFTGTYAYFMGQGRGKILWGNFPGGKITDQAKPIFTSGNLLDNKHYWVNRGELHAGVLTTPIYHAVTNGRRAKANRVYETFLCRKFVVPAGANPDPSDANPDLTKRAYCSYCHRSLEPMAAFFNKWPATGSVNYLYENDPKVNDSGRFDGESGSGAVALGKILAQSVDFEDCSVKRAFEFANGRKMTATEANNLLNDYRGTLLKSGMNMRALLKSMVLSSDFLAPKEK